MARVKQVNIGGTAYDVADKVARNTLADEFSTSKAYAVGDYCIYDNTLYKCTTAKTAGAWSSSYFASTTVAQELPRMKKAEGTNCELLYNDDIVVMTFNGAVTTSTANVNTKSDIELPEGVRIKSTNTAGWFTMALINSSWGATGVNAYVSFESSDGYFRIRTSEKSSNYRLIGSVTMPRENVTGL